MRTFRNYVEMTFGYHMDDQMLVKDIREKLKVIRHLESDVAELVQRISQGHAPVQQAMQHFLRSSQALEATITSAVEKDANNPEMGDHPPVSIPVN